MVEGIIFIAIALALLVLVMPTNKATRRPRTLREPTEREQACIKAGLAYNKILRDHWRKNK